MAATERPAASATGIDPDAILEILHRHDEGMGAAALATASGVAHMPLRDRLRQWEASGLVRRTGNTKATLWHLVRPDGPSASAPSSGEADNGPRPRRLVRPEPKVAAAAQPPVGKKARAPRKPRASKLDAYAHLLGEVPDRDLASRAGVSLSLVRQARVKLGRPARRLSKRRAEAGPKPAPAPSPQADAAEVRATPEPSPTMAIWRVRTEADDVAFVLGATIGDAVSAAMRRLDRTIVGVEYVADVLGPPTR